MRLTAKIKRPDKEDLIVYTKGTYEDTIPAEMTKNDIRAILKKLAEYEDAEEQGLLLRLPCRIGADVYSIPSKTNFLLNLLNRHEGENRVFHQKIERITIVKGGWHMECDSDLKYGTGRILLNTSYGVTWFLSRAEAEAKLKEMEEK